MYKKELVAIRKRRVLLLAHFLGYIPFMAVFAKGVEYFFSAQTAEKFVPYLFLLYAVALGVAAAKSYLSACPKCGKRFCRWSNIFCKKCNSCGLKL